MAHAGADRHGNSEADRRAGAANDGGQSRGDSGGKGAPAGRGADDLVTAFVRGLSEEERMLVLLLRELYDGDWQAMRSDLENRLAGKPYIFKLANRIRDDISRIEKLHEFETQHGVRLTDYVKAPGE